MAKYRVGDVVTVPGLCRTGDPFPDRVARFEITDITDEYVDIKLLPESERWSALLNMQATEVGEDGLFVEEVPVDNLEFRLPIGTQIRKAGGR